MKIENYDKNFVLEEFLGYASNVFVKLFTGVMLNDLKDVKHFLKEELFSEFEKKVKENEEKNIMQMYDELNVKHIKVINTEIKNNKIYIYVELDSRYMDYILDIKKDKIIKGTNSYRIEKKYHLTFTKTIDAKTFTNKCSGCGATLDTNSTGICSYCGKLFEQNKYEYILEEIEEVIDKL